MLSEISRFWTTNPYIDDVGALSLILLDGVTGKDVADYPDWEVILGTLHLLPMDHALASMAQVNDIL